MSEHLPECLLGHPCQSGEPDHVMQGTIAGIPVTLCGLCMADCICDRLRACEQRILAEQLAGHEMAYYAGVQAARDAVKNAPWLTMCIGTEANPGVEEPWVRATDALNAIDALRED